MFDTKENKDVQPTRPVEPQLIVPMDLQQALAVANNHIVTPGYENTVAWYGIGRNVNVNTDAIQKACGAEEVSVELAYVKPGETFFTKYFEFNYYSLRIVNPTTLPSHFALGKESFPIDSLQVYNAGNIQYAGILFRSLEAQVKPEHIPTLESHGFTCWQASAPYEGTREGPFKNIHTIEEAFGSGAREWVEDYLKGSGEEVLIINRPSN